MEKDGTHTLRLSSAEQLWRRETKGCIPATCTTTTVTSMRAWPCAWKSPTIVSVPLILLCYFHPCRSPSSPSSPLPGCDLAASLNAMHPQPCQLARTGTARRK